MRQITKSEPTYFTQAKKKVLLPKVKGAWDDVNISAIRARLRADMLRDEQTSQCAYCGKAIDADSKNSNIDHFKTRDCYPEMTLEYSNLLVSCNTKDRCSTFKDTHVKSRDEYDNIVNPTIENPNDFLEYLLTGEIVARNTKGQRTIDIFNLRDVSLTQCRLQIMRTLEGITNLPLDEIKDILCEYHCFIEDVYPKLRDL